MAADNTAQLRMDLRFAEPLETEFRLEHARTFSRLDVGWTFLSTGLIILLLPRLAVAPGVTKPELALALVAILLSSSPAVFIWRAPQFWYRQRGRVLSAVRLYKSLAAIHLSKYFVTSSVAVTSWPHLVRYLLLNGRLAVLLHLSLGMRVMFHEFLPLQAIVLAVLLPQGPTICAVDTGFSLPPQPHTAFIMLARFFSRASTLLSLVPHDFSGANNHSCILVLAFAQVIVGFAVPGALMYGRERRWRTHFASQRRLDVPNGAVNRWVDYPLACAVAAVLGACLLWQLLETWGLLYE
ncbi:hypothetical protein WJX72_011707 [[Myrmecia] bisecta]|uniref:Uncharacterized protein n=1 Tax=[Myrmecia] bisecta TaxID=41462 RepID=A0AAW1QA15_9CHLO